MAENQNQAEQTETKTPNEPQDEKQTQQITAEELESAILKKIEARFKADIDGLNRANTKLQNENKSLKQATMSAEEIAAQKIKDAEEKANEALKKAQDYERGLAVSKALNDFKLPASMDKRISGNTPEEIAADVKAFNDFVEAIVAERVKAGVASKIGGETPKGGNTAPVETYQQQYDDAKKAGKMDVAISIKRWAVANGKTLKE